MFGHALALVAILILGSPVLPHDDTLKTALKDLQGEWRLVSAEKSGKKMSLERPADRFLIVITGQSLTIRAEDAVAAQGRRTQEKVGERHNRFTIDPNKTPRHLDIISLDGQEKDQAFACIYRIEKGRFTLCGTFEGDATQRPTQFRTQAGDGRMLCVFEPRKAEK